MYKTKTRITYYDLDARGGLKFSAFLRMAHIAADENATEMGVGFAQLMPLGMSFVLQRFSAVAARLPVYNEAVFIATWPAALERGTFIRKGEMRDQDGNKLIEWASLWLLFDVNERKILRPTALPVQLTGLGDQGVALNPQKIEAPGENADAVTPHSAYMHTVRYADTDTNNHMNNAIYGDLAGNGVFDGTKKHDEDTLTNGWRQLHLNYLAEVRPGEVINVTAVKANETYWVTGETNEADETKPRRIFTAQIA